MFKAPTDSDFDDRESFYYNPAIAGEDRELEAHSSKLVVELRNLKLDARPYFTSSIPVILEAAWNFL